MAGLRTAIRLAPRAQIVRQYPASRVTAGIVQHRHVSDHPLPAHDSARLKTSSTVDFDNKDVDKLIAQLKASNVDMNDFLPYPEPEEHASEPEPEPEPAELGEDPNMNGNWPNPNNTAALPIKRQHRDPYVDWWDPIEKRNYGEPVHEDNDILGVFSPDEYTHFKPGWGGVLLGTFVASVFGLCAVVYQFYPDQPTVSRTFEGGLDAELGGVLARPARASVDEPAPLDRSVA